MHSLAEAAILCLMPPLLFLKGGSAMAAAPEKEALCHGSCSREHKSKTVFEKLLSNKNVLLSATSISNELYMAPHVT